MSADQDHSASVMPESRTANAPDLKKGPSRLHQLKTDLAIAWFQRSFWLHVALRDFRRAYARSFIGSAWPTLAIALQCAVMTLMSSALFGADLRDGAPWVTIGVVIWSFMSGALNESCNALLWNKVFLLESRTSMVGFVISLLIRSLITLAGHFGLIALVLLVFRIAPHWTLILVPVAIFLLCAFLLGAGIFLSVITPRFRDVGPLVGSLLMMGYFATPVLWRPSHLGAYTFIADFNPLSHFLALVREPLLGHAADPVSWVVALGCAIASLAIGLSTLAFNRHRITHWV